jgi:anti-anti-sigma regulatory factor
MLGVDNREGGEAVAGMAKTSKTINLNKCLDFRHRQLLCESLPGRENDESLDIRLNISGLRWIDVFTISAIFKLHEALKKRGSQLSIRGCSEEVYGAILYLGLDKLMSISREPTRGPKGSTL